MNWKERASGKRTEWHRVVCFERLAEIVSQYLKKGSYMYFEGRIQTRNTPTGTLPSAGSREVIVFDMHMFNAAHGNGDQMEEREKCAEDTLFLDQELHAKGNENP